MYFFYANVIISKISTTEDTVAKIHAKEDFKNDESDRRTI